VGKWTPASRKYLDDVFDGEIKKLHVPGRAELETAIKAAPPGLMLKSQSWKRAKDASVQKLRRTKNIQRQKLLFGALGARRALARNRLYGPNFLSLCNYKIN